MSNDMHPEPAVHVVTEALAFCDVSTGRLDLGVKLEVDMTREQALKLHAELGRQLALPDPASVAPMSSAPRPITLATAKVLVPSRGLTSKLWSAMVRSELFKITCGVCEPGRAYCPHYAAIAIDAADIIQHMGEFATVVKRNEVRNAGPAAVKLGFELVEALKLLGKE